MLRPRLIPCLLVHRGGLVKTVRFADPKYVGDPLNAVKIFNEKEVDELFVADIDASVLGREPDYQLISKLASECRMPLCYAGGVKTADQIDRIIGLGVEKVAIGSAAVETPDVIAKAAGRAGSQSVVVVLDIKKSGLLRRYEVFTHNGRKKANASPEEIVARSIELGAGEIIINAIEADGTMSGYDLELVDRLRDICTVPMTVLGGAGSLDDVKDLISKNGVIGAAAGSLFVFKGKYRAVLIQYPGRDEKDALFEAATARG